MEATMTFVRQNNEFNPLDNADDISAKLINSLADEISFKYENGENRLTLSGIRDKLNE